MEILGYIATALTVLSFVPKDQIKLRLINGIASIIWIVYGIGINEMPIILVNAIVLAVHMWWFFKWEKTITFDTTYTADKKVDKKIMTQSEWNRERDKMANDLKHDPDFMYKWIKKNSGK